jgi:osomolarity two-component system, sensor histidine kinase NIK1
MSRHDETLTSAASFIRGLGRGGSSQTSAPQGSRTPAVSAGASLDLHRCKLAGPKSAGKDALEAELFALSQRIQYLETRAETVSQALPDTPNEFPNPASPFARNEDNKPLYPPFSRPEASRPPNRNPSISNRSVRVNNLLAARDARNGELGTARTVSEDDIGYLREHVQKQAEEIRSQKDMITEISKGLIESDQRAKLAFHKVETEDVGVLERELRKHQQANEAFQKALREIGGIITQVANGDLSMRVQIQASEMDAEIATFKRTINTMMDQLEVFGSEVSRVAREVGTEGTLGGQAQISGVHGIWKELTENGKCWKLMWALVVD